MKKIFLKKALLFLFLSIMPLMTACFTGAGGSNGDPNTGGGGGGSSVSANDLTLGTTAYVNGITTATIDNGSNLSNLYHMYMKYRNSDGSVKIEYDYVSDCSYVPLGGNGSYIFTNYNYNGTTVNGTLSYNIVYNGGATNFSYVFSGTLNFSGNVNYSVTYDYVYSYNGGSLTYTGYWKIGSQYFSYNSNGTVSTNPVSSPPSFNKPQPVTSNGCGGGNTGTNSVTFAIFNNTDLTLIGIYDSTQNGWESVWQGNILPSSDTQNGPQITVNFHGMEIMDQFKFKDSNGNIILTEMYMQKQSNANIRLEFQGTSGSYWALAYNNSQIVCSPTYQGQFGQVNFGSGGGGGIPSTPTGISVGSVSASSLTISWNPVSGASGYRVFRSDTSNGVYNKIGTDITSGTFYTDSALSLSTTYYYKVSAYNASGESAESSYASGTTTSGGSAPSTPTGLSVGSATSSSLTITWNPVAGADGYRVYRSISSGGPYSQVGVDITSGTSYPDSSLSPSTTYYYRLSAYNSNGESAQSSYTSGMTTSGGSGGPLSITGANITTGTYALSGISYTFNSGNSCIKSSGGNSYTGTWAYSGGNLNINSTYESSGIMKMDSLETYNAGYTINSGVNLFLFGWKKTSGPAGSIIGMYEYSYSVQTKAYSWNGSSWIIISDSTMIFTATIEYNADYTWTTSVTIDMNPDPGNSYPLTTSSSGTWSDSEVSSGSLKFVDFNGVTYLYSGTTGSYVKQ